MSTTINLNDTKEKQKHDLKEAYDRLEQALNGIETNEEWLKFLRFQARFHNYSFSNSILICLQNPNATYVAGYSKWKSMGRSIKRGERALKIFAPCKYRVNKDNNEAENSKDAVYILKGFHLASVFDLSQTIGDDSNLPVLICGLKDANSEAANIYEKLKIDIRLQVSEVSGTAVKGSYNIQTQAIIIRDKLSDLQKLKTLIHEYSHHLHLTKYPNNETRDMAEIIGKALHMWFLHILVLTPLIIVFHI